MEAFRKQILLRCPGFENILAREVKPGSNFAAAYRNQANCSAVTMYIDMKYGCRHD
jgi:hypothetical protein